MGFMAIGLHSRKNWLSEHTGALLVNTVLIPGAPPYTHVQGTETGKCIVEKHETPRVVIVQSSKYEGGQALSIAH